MKDLSKSYTWYSKDWGTNRIVFNLTLAERGLFRELIDQAYATMNRIPIDHQLWARFYNSTVTEIENICTSLEIKGLIVVQGEYLQVPSVNKRIKAVLDGSKGGNPLLTNNDIKSFNQNKKSNTLEPTLQGPVQPSLNTATKKDSSVFIKNDEKEGLIKKLLKSHCDFFAIPESNMRKQMDVFSWMNQMNQKDLEYLVQNFSYYERLVNETGRFAVGIDTWMRDKWNSQDYRKILKGSLDRGQFGKKNEEKNVVIYSKEQLELLRKKE